MSRKKNTTPVWISNLRTLMEARELNPRSLSLKAGLNATAVRDMLEGRTKSPRYDTIKALTDVLEVTPAQFMGSPVTPSNMSPAEPEQDQDLGLLTEIIARLQEVAQEHRHKLVPRDFAAMVTTIYREVQGSKTPNLGPRISNLMQYEKLRKRARL